MDRLTTLLYLALLAAFLVRTPGAMHPEAEGLRAWLGFSAKFGDLAGSLPLCGSPSPTPS
ncbi:MAG: hypothetical protein IPK63_09740 [Candidatus Competibacteraceae bacterium]|nr:hypothetical protein [Candidatus Competibacteraceae bacterium]